MPNEPPKTESGGNNGPLTGSLDCQVGPNTPTFHANKMLIQEGESESSLLFFETPPPDVVGTPEENAGKIKGMPAAVAKCVARIIISKELAPKIGMAIIENVDAPIYIPKATLDRLATTHRPPDHWYAQVEEDLF